MEQKQAVRCHLGTRAIAWVKIRYTLCLERILSNFNVVASPKFFNGFRNAKNVRDTRKTSCRYLSPPNRPISAIIANFVMEDVEKWALFWKKIR